MDSVVQAPLKLLKWILLPPEDSPDETCEATADPCIKEPEETGRCNSNLHNHNHNSCQPTTIITSDGRKILPKSFDLNISDTCNHTFSEDLATQTTPTARRSLYEGDDQSNELRQINRIIQVPSERCLISPLGTVSDSYLPDKIVRIRRRERMQKLRYLERSREKEERERQREMLRKCALSGTYQDHVDTNPSVHRECRKAGKKVLGLLLRSGKQLKYERPKRTCQCCCCVQSFCIHKTHYLNDIRNPSCENCAVTNHPIKI